MSSASEYQAHHVKREVWAESSRAYELELTRDQQHLEVKQRPVPLWIKVTLSKLPQQRRQFPQAVLFDRLFLGFCCFFFFPDERELEPKPILCRRGDSGNVPTRKFDSTDELVQRLLVRVGRRGSVADSLVVLGEESISEQFRESGVRGLVSDEARRHRVRRDLSVPPIGTVQPGLEVSNETLL